MKELHQSTYETRNNTYTFRLRGYAPYVDAIECCKPLLDVYLYEPSLEGCIGARYMQLRGTHLRFTKVGDDSPRRKSHPFNVQSSPPE